MSIPMAGKVTPGKLMIQFESSRWIFSLVPRHLVLSQIIEYCNPQNIGDRKARNTMIKAGKFSSQVTSRRGQSQI